MKSTTGNYRKAWYKRIFSPFTGLFRKPEPTGPKLVDLRGKVVLMDNDELLLVWERRLRNIRLQKEEEAWNQFEAKYGAGNPEVTKAFVQWQEGLYRYIEREKDRFLKVRQGTVHALDKLVQQGARTIVVTKGAKPYTQKCFHLTGLSSSITDIYSPPPGSRQKQFADAVRDYGINSLEKCLKHAIVVGHDLDMDMAWELVPPKGPGNDGCAPVFLLLDTLVFEEDVIAPLDAMTEVIELLVTRGRNDIWRGFNSLQQSQHTTTTNYQFKVGLYNHPRLQSKARIPVVYDVRRIGVSF